MHMGFFAHGYRVLLDEIWDSFEDLTQQSGHKCIIENTSYIDAGLFGYGYRALLNGIYGSFELDIGLF